MESQQDQQQATPRPGIPLEQAQANLIEAAALLEKFVRNRALTTRQRDTLLQIVRGMTALALEGTVFLAQAQAQAQAQAKAAEEKADVVS